MPATVYQHPRAYVKFDPPPETQASLVNALMARDAELDALPPYTPPTEEEWRRLDAVEAIGRLIEEYGAARVMSWCRNVAAMKGQEVS